MNTIHRINQNQAASKYVPLPTSEIHIIYLLLRIHLLLFMKSASFFSARNNMKCIRMHDRFKFPATLDKCYILSKGHFLWPYDLVWPNYSTHLHNGVCHT